jgi:hypothetical protein
LFAVVCIVATPFVFVGWLIHRIFEHRAKVALALAPPRMALPSAPSPDVERRLASLEAIVASLDFDLAAKLRELERTRGHAA